jgi:hypothetical protein
LTVWTTLIEHGVHFATLTSSTFCVNQHVHSKNATIPFSTFRLAHLQEGHRNTTNLFVQSLQVHGSAIFLKRRSNTGTNYLPERTM